MASNPNTTENRATEAAALALLLATTKRRYDLPALLRANGIRPRPFRPIKPTLALKYDLSAPYYAIVKAWVAALPDILAAIPLGRAAVASALEQAASRAGFSVMQAKAQFPRIVSRIEAWHRAQWTQRVKTSTGLDVSMLTSPQDVADPMQATTSWNGQLADDVHSQIKSKLAAALLVGGIAAVDAKARANDVLAKARKRAGGIGSDQVAKLSEGMTHARREAAGITQWMWQHNTPEHFRPEHKARNGQIYSDETAPDDRPGDLPFCRCLSIPLLN